jgi:threonine/homoserine/homoserine lactone efflux protein
MTAERVLAIVAFSIAAAGTPGPSNALLVATGATVGVVRGLPALLGVAASMGMLMFVVAVGLGSVIVGHAALYSAARWIGAAVLCWFAWKIATSRAAGVGGGARPVGFLGAAGFQWINPKSWVISASAAATFLNLNLNDAGGTIYGQASILAIVFALAVLPSCLPWLAFGAVLQRLLRSERAVRAFNIGLGVLLAASVVMLVT